MPIAGSLKRARELASQRVALIDELDRSLALQALWPEVFAAGRASSTWLSSYGNEPVLVVTDGNGEQRRFKDSQVPACIMRPTFPPGHSGRKSRLFNKPI